MSGVGKSHHLKSRICWRNWRLQPQYINWVMALKQGHWDYTPVAWGVPWDSMSETARPMIKCFSDLAEGIARRCRAWKWWTRSWRPASRCMGRLWQACYVFWGETKQNVWDMSCVLFMGNVTGLFIVSCGFLWDVLGYWDKMEYSIIKIG